MKKLLFLLLMSLSIYSQKTEKQNEPYIINKCVDADSFHPKNGFICSNDLRTRWFMVVPTYICVEDSPVASGFQVIKLDIGRCSKNDLLVITFTDRTKIILRSTNTDLSCDTWINFKLDVSMTDMLKTKYVDTMRYINGNDNNNEVTTFVYYLKENEKKFFMNAYSNFIIEKVYCK